MAETFTAAQVRALAMHIRVSKAPGYEGTLLAAAEALDAYAARLAQDEQAGTNEIKPTWTAADIRAEADWYRECVEFPRVQAMLDAYAARLEQDAKFAEAAKRKAVSDIADYCCYCGHFTGGDMEPHYCEKLAERDQAFRDYEAQAERLREEGRREILVEIAKLNACSSPCDSYCTFCGNLAKYHAPDCLWLRATQAAQLTR